MVSFLSKVIVIVGVECLNNACSKKRCGTAGSLVYAVVGPVDRDLLRCHNGVWAECWAEALDQRYRMREWLTS